MACSQVHMQTRPTGSDMGANARITLQGGRLGLGLPGTNVQPPSYMPQQPQLQPVVGVGGVYEQLMAIIQRQQSQLEQTLHQCAQLQIKCHALGRTTDELKKANASLLRETDRLQQLAEAKESELLLVNGLTTGLVEISVGQALQECLNRRVGAPAVYSADRTIKASNCKRNTIVKWCLFQLIHIKMQQLQSETAVRMFIKSLNQSNPKRVGAALSIIDEQVLAPLSAPSRRISLRSKPSVIYRRRREWTSHGESHASTKELNSTLRNFGLLGDRYTFISSDNTAEAEAQAVAAPLPPPEPPKKRPFRKAIT